jgi:L-ascorbate metabolism protein UlaG (beta-lactamase superfamily)
MKAGVQQVMRILFLSLAMIASPALAQRSSDSLPAAGGDVVITPIAHGTVHIAHGSAVVLVDPTVYGGWDGPHPGGVAPQMNYEGLKPPTVILVTDIHGDHYDSDAIGKLRTAATKIVVPAVAGWQWQPTDVTPLPNGKSATIGGVTVEAVPMYNLQRGPNAATKFHTKGRGNGYVVTLGGKRLYFSGDTECTPEMKALKNIDVAFIAMNLPYTATPAEAAECAAAFKPSIAYPYHYKGQDVKEFESKLAGSGVDVRLRDWYQPR